MSSISVSAAAPADQRAARAVAGRGGERATSGARRRATRPHRVNPKGVVLIRLSSEVVLLNPEI